MALHSNYQWLRLGLLTCMLMAVPSSSFFLAQYLTKQVITGEYSQVQLDFALKKNNKAALLFAWQQTKKHSHSWLSLAKKVAKSEGEAAYQLGLFYHNQHSINQAIAWYQRAIRLKFKPAFVALAQYYFDNNKLVKANEILAQLSKIDDEPSTMAAKVLTINMAISRGDLDVVKHNVAEFRQSLQTIVQGRLLLDNISKYQVLNLSSNSRNFPSCDNSIQLFASSFAHLQRLEYLIKGVKQYALSQHVCFSPVRYLAIDTLACTADSAQAIQCREQHWQHLAESINTRFVGVLLPEGGANVHLGSLYVDVNDTIDIFVHEISHLLGFVDEYPLAKDHAICTAIQQQAFSENIAVLKNLYQGNRADIRVNVLQQLAWGKQIKKSTPILQRIKGHSVLTPQWRLGTPKEFEHEIGIFQAQTCAKTVNDNRGDESNFNAYKPLVKATKMQYFSLDFPAEYRLFLQESLGQFLMPSFHYNIALAHFQQGNLEQARYWLKQSANWENKPDRQKKILQGNF